MLTKVNFSRKNLKGTVNNILEDLNANIEDFQTDIGQKINRRKIRKLKKKKQFIESKLAASSWLKKLIDDQLKNEENYFTFGENF